MGTDIDAVSDIIEHMDRQLRALYLKHEDGFREKGSGIILTSNIRSTAGEIIKILRFRIISGQWFTLCSVPDHLGRHQKGCQPESWTRS